MAQHSTRPDVISPPQVLAEELARDATFCARPDNREAVRGGKRKDAGKGVTVELDHTAANIRRLNCALPSGDVAAYHQNFRNTSRPATVASWAGVQALVPPDLLRRRLLAMSLTAEAFLALRQEFAETLAASSLFGYLLGVGDRHLDNLLLDGRSGAIVQIDFGVCFGMGASVLPVPELLPFRCGSSYLH
jgi:hypothetical protein